MIFFYGEGRLGNQIFQYQALTSIAKPSETIVAVGLEDLHDMFDLHGAKLRVLSNSLLVKRIFKFFVNPFLLLPLARWLRLINYVEEPITGPANRKGNSGEQRLYRGLFQSLTFVKGGYYQNPSLWKTAFPAAALHLNSTIGSEVQNYLLENVSPHKVPLFVHIRRGDYLNYSSYGLNDLTLPESFYRSAISLVSKEIRNAFFVFVTDDQKWVADTFSDIHNKSIASISARFDFALMTQCRGGILSNSTYSLCAALMMDTPEIVIAPQYWFGFRVNEWYPPRIRVHHERMRYIPTCTDSA